MKFQRLLELVGGEPLFSSDILLAGDVSPATVQRQLSLWVKKGRLYQLRRGLYALAPPYQRLEPHPFLIANRLVPASYISLQSALAFYGFIPEFTPVTLSVTTGRPRSWRTALGRFEFRHIKKVFWFGYQLIQLDERQQAYVATPEKALLDLIHLEAKADSMAYLKALRLQNLDVLDWERLGSYVQEMGVPKLNRAMQHLLALRQSEIEEYEWL